MKIGECIYLLYYLPQLLLLLCLLVISYLVNGIKLKTMSEFHDAWYKTCSVHKDTEHPMWRKCPKCSEVITYSEEEVFELIGKFDYCGWTGNFIGPDTRKEWFEQNKKSKALPTVSSHG
jgi:hypothetical protein